jgi:BetI-type transcriptional repressor, C-terminal
VAPFLLWSVVEKCCEQAGVGSNAVGSYCHEAVDIRRNGHRLIAAGQCDICKDDLIASAAEESLTGTKGVLDELRGRRPVPGPRETLTAITRALQRQIDQPDYDLSKITVNAWAEALRQPQLHERAYRFYRETHKSLVELARLWQSAGLVAPDGDPTSIANLFITLMPGMIITRHLYRPATAARLAEGMLVFAAADSR